MVKECSKCKEKHVKTSACCFQNHDEGLFLEWRNSEDQLKDFYYLPESEPVEQTVSGCSGRKRVL